MAHTDACKIQVTQFVKKCCDGGLALNEACRHAEQESDGIPSSTIKRWWYEVNKETSEQFKNEPQDATAENDEENNCSEASKVLTIPEMVAEELASGAESIVAASKTVAWQVS